MLANFMPRRHIGQQGRGGGRVFAEPLAEGLLGAFDGRPDRPQRVVQIQGDGLDKRQVSMV